MNLDLHSSLLSRMQHTARGTEKKQPSFDMRVMADAVSHPAFVLNPFGATVYLNKTWLGLTQGQTSAPWMAVLHGDDFLPAQQLWQQCLQKGALFESQMRLMDGAGRGVWHQVRISPARAPSGEILFWMGVATALEAFNRPQSRVTPPSGSAPFRDELDVILKGVTDGIAVVDQEGQIHYANDTAATLLGYSCSSELMKHTVPAVLEPLRFYAESGEPLMNQQLPYHFALEGFENPPEMIVRICNTEKRLERWCILNASPVFDSNHSVRFCVNIFRDFTARKKTEERSQFAAEAATLLGSSLDFTTTLNNLTKLAVPRLADWCAVDLLSPNGEFERLAGSHSDSDSTWENARFWNQRFPPVRRASLGLGAVARTGKPILISQVTDEMKQAYAENPEHLRLIRKLPLHSYLCVPLHVQGRVVGGFTLITSEPDRELGPEELLLAQDLASKASFAIANARLYSESVRINRIKDDFLATLSHELRTPLNVIQGHAELLRSEPEIIQSEILFSSVEAIHRNARSQTQLIENLLDVSELITGTLCLKTTNVRIDEMVQMMAQAFAANAQARGIQFACEAHSDCLVPLDVPRFRQILWNLVSNALKFTPSGGRVVLSTERKDNTCLIQVRDTGVGIQEDFLPYVFDRFRQEDSGLTRRHGGLGLGLSIVKNLIELHGGTASIASEGRDLGCTVNLRFPLARLERRV